MRRVMCVTLAGLLLAGPAAAAQPGQAKGHGQGHSGHAKGQHADAAVDVHVAFGSGDVIVIRDYYAPRYRNLPPGLQKKLARGGQLPPGWQKRFEPFPVALDRRLPPLPAGYRRGVIDGHAVIYDSRSTFMVDVAVLF